MAKKRDIFAGAEDARRRAVSGERDSITQILDRLRNIPRRELRFLLVDNEESVIRDWRDTLATYAALRSHADFQLFHLVEPGEVSQVKNVHSGNVDRLLELI